MADKSTEDAIKACYSTWSDNYYDEYYGAKAAYPPVHREILKRLLKEAGVRNVLDAGCGPASFLRELTESGIELYGFDLTPEMVREARRVLEERGVPTGRVWEGSVLAPESFRHEEVKEFDAAICIGVFPHIPEEADAQVIENLRGAVKQGGLVVIEARNQLFSLFTLNRYSHQFFMEELIRTEKLKEKAEGEAEGLAGALSKLERQFRMDLPPVRKGREDEPGYDEVLSRTHNPLVLKESFARAGFRDVRLLFYHYHALPPMLAADVPELFRRESLAMEDAEDWRGHFMASAFLVAGRRQ
jgi:2-polyprenyl-3-methyl-5-hydroxy-6-metoxy-1,4-benzoquinol methylase